MRRSNSVIIIFLVMFVAFFSGYQGDALGNSMNEASNWLASTANSALSIFDAEEETAPPESPSEKKAATTTNKPTQAINFPPPTPTRVAPEASRRPAPARNPYEQMMRSQNNAPTLGNTIGSMKQQNMNEGQQKRRNLYFERLSEQMKALKGEVPKLPPADAVKPRLPTSPAAIPPSGNEPPEMFDSVVEEESEEDQLEMLELEEELREIGEAPDEVREDEELLVDVLNELDQ